MPFQSQSQQYNVFKVDNYHWGKPQIDGWKKAMAEYNRRKTEVSSSHHGRLSSKATIAFREQHVKRLKALALISYMVESAERSSVATLLITPRDKAAFFDHLFMSWQPDATERRKTLITIFDHRYSLEHEVYAKIIWDYTRPNVMRLWAKKKTDKYQ